MATYLPIRSISRSQSVRIGTQVVTPSTTTYVDISDGKTRRDLSHHTAIGAVIVVGPLSANNSDAVVISGGAVTAGTGLSVNVSAGELEVRSSGVHVNGAAATNHALSAAHATLDRTDLVWWDTTSGAVGHTNGANAAAGTSVAPTTPAGKVGLATVLVAATATVPGTITDVRPRP